MVKGGLKNISRHIRNLESALSFDCYAGVNVIVVTTPSVAAIK